MSDTDEDMMDDEFDSDEELDFNDGEGREMLAHARSPLESRRQLERRRELSELRRLLDDPYLELD